LNSNGILRKRDIYNGTKPINPSINYHKTTFLPIHVPQAEADALAASFGTTTSAFPQTYLASPLAPTKSSSLTAFL
jgi:hypothetical protein